MPQHAWWPVRDHHVQILVIHGGTEDTQMDTHLPHTCDTIARLQYERDRLRAECQQLLRQLDAANVREATLCRLLTRMQEQYARLVASGAVQPTPDSPLLTPPPRTLSANRERILAYLDQHPGPHHHEEISEALNLPVQVRQILKHMERQGSVLRVKQGYYAAVPRA